MKIRLTYILIAFVIILGAGYLLGRHTATAPTKEIVPTKEVEVSISATPSAKTTEVKLFFVLLNNQGESTASFGCGDSIVPVVREVAPTTMPLTAALTQLLSIKSQYYGQSGLYNSLYQSNLRLLHANVAQGIASVYLVGTLKLGGVCDDPRVEMQLTKTVLQFPTVKEAKIFINNIPLHEALSEK